MAKYCLNFPNCTKLAQRFGVNQGVLNVFINLYNKSVPVEDRISAEKEYSDDELDVIYNKILSQREESKKDRGYDIKERGMIIHTFGGPEAVAFQQATSVFSAEELDEITSEIAGLFIDKAVKFVESRDAYSTVEDLLNKIGNKGISQLFNLVAKDYLNKLTEARLIIQGGVPVASSNIQTVEQAEKIEEIIDRLTSKGEYVGTVFDSMKVLALPLINAALGIRIHGDFNIDSSENVSYELAASVQDMEESMQERYMQALDAQGLEDSLSGIIARILMQVPRTKSVVHIKYNEEGEVVDTSLEKVEVKSNILGRSLYSDPRVIARRLTLVLANATTEEEMMKALQETGYNQLLDKLNEDPTKRTTFFQAFNRYMQQYRAVSVSKNADGTIKVNTPTLGKSKNEGLDSFISRLSRNIISSNSVFTFNEETGKAELKLNTKFDAARTWFMKTFFSTGEDGKVTTQNSSFELSSPSMKETFLTTLMEFINIPVTEKGIGILMSDPSKLASFIAAADKFFTVGGSNLGTNYRKYQRVNMFLNIRDIRNAIGTMMSLVEQTPKSFYGSRVTYEGSTLSTSIMNSPLSILSKNINSLIDHLVSDEDSRGPRDYMKAVPGADLSNYILQRYLMSPQYMKDGRILNRWLKDIMACSTAFDEESMKSIFGFSRDLGIDHIKTEDISDRLHMMLMLHGYLGGRNISDNTDETLVDSEEEAVSQSIAKPGKRFVVSGTPYYYIRGKRQYRTDTSYIPSFITGDTNAVRQIRTIHYYEEEVIDGMYDLFLADKQNQRLIDYFNSKGIVFSANGKEAYTSRQVKVRGKYSRRSNADKFGILQFLNKRRGNEVGSPTWYQYFINLAAERQGLDPKSLTKDQITNLEADENTFKEVCREYLNEGYEEFKKQLRDFGLLETTGDGKYVQFDSYLGSNESNKEAQLERYLRDFYFDYKFSLYNQAHLFQVNPLFFNGVEEYQKRNKGTLTNGSILSMMAQDMDGNYLWDYNPEDGTFDFTSKVVYFKDVKVGLDEDSRRALVTYFTNQFAKTSKSLEEARKKAEKHVNRFNSNSLTDGQAYRSFESYRKVLMSAGRQFWTNVQERAYNEIMSIIAPIRIARQERGEILSLTASEIQRIEDLMTVMQPIKPINDNMENVNTDLGVVKVAFQFKYAEIPIIPELLPVGSKLRELGDAMVDLHIDMMASDKCLKKGSFGEMDLQYKMVGGKYVDAKGNVLPGMDENGKIIDDGTQTAAQQRANRYNENKFVEYDKGTSVRDIFDSHYVDESDRGYVIHTIPMENYLIQTNMPDHTDGNSIVGTQPRKIGTGAIIKDKNYHYSIGPTREGGEQSTVDGEQLARIYGVAHALKYAKSYNKFLSRVDDTSGMVSDLIYNMLNNGRGNLGLISRLTLLDGSNPTVPFSELSTAREIQNNLISIFKKTVIRQQISGGSIVQASSLGSGKTALTDTGLHAIIDWQDKENGIGTPIAMQAEMPFDFHYVDESGNMIPLRYEDYCDEDGYFLDVDGNPVKEDRYDSKDVQLKIERDFPGILDIVAYRIPTEMEYSMFHLRIVKCNPKTGSNVIKLPAECTTIAGFDFDIDKLFLMRHNFHTSEGIDEYTVWSEFYKRNPAIAIALYNKWVEDGSKKDTPRYSYWDSVMAENPSFLVDYPDKNAAYQQVKGQLQKESIPKTPFNYDMSPEDLVNLSQSELDNLIIDCTIAILSDPSTVGDRYAVGGFEDASFDAKLMRLLMAGFWTEGSFSEFVAEAERMEDYKPEYDYSEPLTSIIFKEQNQIAGTLIGIFANDSINNFISQGLKRLSINSPQLAIKFGSFLDGITELDGRTSDIDTSDLGTNFLHKSVNGKSIKRTLAELLAAAVDAVKDPVLNYLNLNSITADAAAMLARLGYTTRDIGLLFNQPVIKRMCTYMNRTGETSVRRALTKVLEEMGSKNPVGLFKSTATSDTSILTSERLAMGLSPDSDVDIKTQETVAQLFNSIMLTKNEFSNYVQQTRNTSANTIKSKFEDYLSAEAKQSRQFSRIDIVTSDEINFPITYDITEKDLTDRERMKELVAKYKDHPFIYENIVAAIIRNGMQHMMDRYTLLTTPKYEQYRTTLESLIAPWGLSGTQIEVLSKDLPVLDISRGDKNGDFNPYYKSDGVTPNAIRYIDSEYFITQLDAFLQANPELLEKLPILSNLDVDRVNYNSDAPRLMLKYSRSITPTEKLMFTLSWDALMNMGGDAAEIAKGLFLHFYYTRGLNPESNLYMELAPVSVLESLMVDSEAGISYLDYYDREQDFYDEEDSLQVRKDLYQLIMTHNDDSSFVKVIDVNIEDCRGANSEELIFRKSKSKTASSVKNNLDLVILQKKTSGNKVIGAYYAPVIKVAGQTYVLAKLEGGEYVVDYDNYKRTDIETVQYIPVQSIISSEEADELYSKLGQYYTGQNNLIFRNVTDSASISAILDSESVRTDTSTSDDTAEEAYDASEEKTKDDEVESSDGRPKCHSH